MVQDCGPVSWHVLACFGHVELELILHIFNDNWPTYSYCNYIVLGILGFIVRLEFFKLLYALKLLHISSKMFQHVPTPSMFHHFFLPRCIPSVFHLLQPDVPNKPSATAAAAAAAAATDALLHDAASWRSETGREMWKKWMELGR